MSRRTMALGLALAGALVGLACGPKAQDSGGKVRIATQDARPVFDWDACTEFGVKRCGERIKVTSLVIVPLDCTVGGKPTGERPVMWQVMAGGTFGATLTPPVVYGVTPAGASEPTQAYELVSGCRYVVRLGLLDGSVAGTAVSEEFAW